MPCRYASSAPSAPSTGVQTLPQPRRDAMVIGERYVPDRGWKAGWRSSHGEKCNRAITGTRLRKTMKCERRGEMSRQGDGAEVPGPSSIPTARVTGRKTHDPPPLLLPKTCVAYVYGISTRDCTCQEVAAPAAGTCPERREMESPFRKDDDANVEAFIRAPFQLLSLACPSPGSTTWKEGKTGDLLTRETAAATWNRPLVHRMQSVTSSLSGPGLGSGWSSSLPHPHSGPPAVRLGAGTGQPCDQPARRGIMVRGGQTEAADGPFPRYLLRGGDSSSEGWELTSMITAETWGTGRLVLDSGDGDTSAESAAWPRESEGSSN